MKLISLLSVAFIVSVDGQSACPGNSAISGYTTIAAINSAIAADLSAIKGGSSPSPPYVFTLCPNVVFTSDQALTASLSGAKFVCGAKGAVTDSCVIKGGATQVLVQDPGVSGYTLQNVSFSGITFEGSSVASIVANASSATTANFIDCSWSDFSGNAAIQLSSTSTKAATVVITGGTVPSGTSTAIFSNDNGSLAITGLNITGFDGADGIITSNGGATSIQSTDITGLGTGLLKVLLALGNGTTMDVNATSIHDIALPSGQWDGITYSQGATGVVEGCQFLRNSGVEFAIDVLDGGVANVTDTTFQGNAAVVGAYSSIYYALNNSKLYLFNDNAIDNSGFFFYGFTGFQSFTNYDDTTFVGGQVILAVFLDQDSTFSLTNINFTNVVSDACPPPQQREFIEDVGSHCFYRQPGNCTGVCGVVTNTTSAPSVAPVAPTLAPVVTTVAPTTAPIATTAPTTTPIVTTPAPTTSPVAATPAPSSTTAFPSVAPIPEARTIAPSTTAPSASAATTAPSAATTAPSAATTAPSAATTAPSTATIASSSPSTAPSAATTSPHSTTTAPVLYTKVPIKTPAKKAKKAPKAKKGVEPKGKAKLPGPPVAGKKGPTASGVAKKAKGAAKAPVAYTPGATKKAKGPAPPAPVTGKLYKKPKYTKGNEGALKGGLLKKSKSVSKTTTKKSGGGKGETTGGKAQKKSAPTATSPTTTKTGKGGSYGTPKPKPAPKPTESKTSAPTSSASGTNPYVTAPTKPVPSPTKKPPSVGGGGGKYGTPPSPSTQKKPTTASKGVTKGSTGPSGSGAYAPTAAAKPVQGSTSVKKATVPASSSKKQPKSPGTTTASKTSTSPDDGESYV